MGVLSREIEAIQNPALGATLLWRFTVGFSQSSKSNDPTPIPLLFIVLPIMFHEETAQFITSTRLASGLRAFSDKFSTSAVSKNDLVLAIHDRSLDMRKLTLDSVRLGISSRLIGIDVERGVVSPLSTTTPRANVPESIRPLLAGAERLGGWCAQISLHEVSAILKVAF
jgi:hypothetical protein